MEAAPVPRADGAAADARVEEASDAEGEGREAPPRSPAAGSDEGAASEARTAGSEDLSSSAPTATATATTTATTTTATTTATTTTSTTTATTTAPATTTPRDDVVDEVVKGKKEKEEEEDVDDLEEDEDDLEEMNKPEKAVRALLVVDVQNDFIPSEDGSLAVPNAEEVIPVINELRSKQFDFVYLCLDWHPNNHCSFRTNNPGSDVFQVVHLPSTGNAQIMWPDHCVQGTHGAELHKDLLVETSDIWTYAGCNPQRDSYSVFKDNGSSVLTEMRSLLEENQVTELYAVGLATDYCVQYTLLDAKVLLQGVDVFFIQDGCRGINEDSVQGALKAFEFEKVNVINSRGPELGLIPDRKLRIDGTLELTKRAVEEVIYPEVDELYEAIVFPGVDIDLEVLDVCMKRGTINQRCSWSCKGLLHACCETGNIAMLSRLFDVAGENLDLTVRTKKEENALMFAVQCSFPERRLGLVQVLLERCTEHQQRELLRGQTKQTRLTALMLACRMGDCDVVELLLAYESSMSFLQIGTSFGKTALMYACMQDTPEHAGIAEMLLTSQDHVDDRLLLVGQRDNEFWNALHFSAKSGCFAGVDWARALGSYEAVARLPINALTNSGISFLHLAAFNGKSEVVRTVLESQAPQRHKKIFQAYFKKGLMHKIEVNVPIKATKDTELDLAIKRRHLETARLLLRLKCHAKTSGAEQLHELLHRLVLMGDVEACESILNFADENRITVDESLVETTQRIEHPETCTFSFANYTNPVKQFLYRCQHCGNKVCLVCKDRCHGIDTCRQAYSKLDQEHFPEKGWEFCGTSVSHCECNRDKCCATVATDAREIEGYRFVPRPISTKGIHLDAMQLKLSKMLARNTHNVWAQNLVEDGWNFGREKDPAQKLHPLLLPFDQLQYEGAKYNLDMALETLKVIQSLGFKLVKATNSPQSPDPDDGLELSSLGKPRSLITALDNFAQGTTASIIKLSKTPASAAAGAPSEPDRDNVSRRSSWVKYSNIVWSVDRPKCRPIDTTGVRIPPEIEDLVESIAANSHEVWASGKVRQGWRYAPERNIKKGLKLNASLVPYQVLAEAEKSQLAEGARETLKLILHFGYSIVEDNTNLLLLGGEEAPGGGNLDGDNANGSAAKLRLSIPHASPKRATAAPTPSNARRRKKKKKKGSAESQKRSVAFHQLKHVRRKLFNQFLFAAVRRGQINSVNILLSKRASMFVGADLNAVDEFGHTPLYIAIKRGHSNTARRLLELGANVELRDINGLTPLALAAYLGNLSLCQELVQNFARILVTDNMGFTPLHHAADQGHVEVCRYLAERLQQEHQSNEIINLRATDDQTPLGGPPPMLAHPQRNEFRLQTFSAGLTGEPAPFSTMSFLRVVRSTIRRNKMLKVIPADLGGKADSALQMGKATGRFEAVDPIDEARSVSPRTPRMSDMSTPRFSMVSLEGQTPPVLGGVAQRESSSLLDINLAPFSPLSMAVRSNNIEIVAMLIKSGGNPMLPDGRKANGSKFSPYVRALFRHIEYCAKVQYLQDLIAKRAIAELEPMGAMKLGKRRLSDFFDRGLHSRRSSGLLQEDVAHANVDVPVSPLRHVPPLTPGGANRLTPFGKKLGMGKRSDSRLMNFFGIGSARGEHGEDASGGGGGDQKSKPAGGSRRASLSKQSPVQELQNCGQLSTRQLDELLALAEAEKASAALMVEVLNSSAQVRAWRKRCALKMFWKETRLLLLLIVTFFFLVQLAPDYDMTSERQWAVKLHEYLSGKIGDAKDPETFLNWLTYDLVGGSLQRKFNRTTLLEQNFVFGGILLQRLEHFGLDSQLANSGERSEALSSEANLTSVVLPQAPMDEVRALLLNETAGWLDSGIQELSIEFNLYNPFYDVFGIVEARQTNSFVGLGASEVSVKPYRVGHGRFPPSREFQLVISGMVIMFSLTKLRAAFSGRRTFRYRSSEWVIELLLAGILILDLVVYAKTHELTVDFESSEFVSLQSVHRLLEVERRTFAVYFLLSTVPLMNAARTIPSIGPVVVALLNTISHTAVLIYLLVLGFACFLLTLAFQVGFGVDVLVFNNLVSSFDSLFFTPFIESWDGMDEISSTSLMGASLSVFYILWATITLNLLIAIVTDVYPAARKDSDSLWEMIITDGIEETLKEVMAAHDSDMSCLKIEYWSREALLRGRDGLKHWEVASTEANKASSSSSSSSAWDPLSKANAPSERIGLQDNDGEDLGNASGTSVEQRLDVLLSLVKQLQEKSD